MQEYRTTLTLFQKEPKKRDKETRMDHFLSYDILLKSLEEERKPQLHEP